MTITKQVELLAIAKVQTAIDKEGLHWIAGETPISHLSPDEKARLYNAKVGPPIAGIPIESRPLYLQGVADPPNFDWRDVDGHDWMTPVLRQGCRDCWAFSTTGVVEAVFNIYTGNPDLNLDLSEQHLVSECCSAGSCNGGWPDLALNYIMKRGVSHNEGIPPESCFPYVAQDSECTPCDNWQDIKYLITGHKYILPTTDDFKWALQEYGPMCVVMTHPEDWFYYTSGVYKPTADAFGWANHAVVLVGWDDSLGDHGAWICKNSHGTRFGEDGYALIDYGVLEGYHYAYAVTGIVYEELGVIVTSFDVSPLSCTKPCTSTINITWENTCRESITFTKGYTVDGILKDDSVVTLSPGGTTSLSGSETFYSVGNYEICAYDEAIT
jgi:C1A family cysteine protease